MLGAARIATAATDAALDELSASFRGELVRPGDSAYAEHRRVWNGSIDHFPALIAPCAGVADVIAAIGLARDAGWVVTSSGVPFR